MNAQKDSTDSLEKLREVENMCSQLQQNVKRFFYLFIFFHLMKVV